MAITKEVVIDKIEVIGEHRLLQFRRTLITKMDGEVIGRLQLPRYVLEPDADTGKENAEIKRLAAAVWTQEIKASHAAAKAAREEL